MMVRTLFCCFAFLTIFSQISAQELLDIPTRNHCTFSGTEWEEELYRFDANPKIQTWVTEICQAGDVTQNFQIIQASVENVAAVFDPVTNKRYLLFSQNFIEKATRLSVYSALAHEIGHHANEHKLTDALRTIEELEADQFMGYVLAKINGIGSLQDIKRVNESLPPSYPSVITDDERIEAKSKGWKRAEGALILKKMGDYSDDPSYDELLKAQFPFPPPPCCSPIELPRSNFGSAQKLGDIAVKLLSALNKQGYVYRTFLSVPNGFALVTQMEQYNADYSHRVDENRWTNAPVGESFTGYLDYFKRLLMPSKAYFRTFVFIVTTNAFNQQGKNVTKNEASAWYGRGINRLPKTIANMPYTEGVTVTALVYEFEVPESNRKPSQKCPSVNTQLHLDKSGITKGF